MHFSKHSNKLYCLLCIDHDVNSSSGKTRHGRVVSSVGNGNHSVPNVYEEIVGWLATGLLCPYSRHTNNAVAARESIVFTLWKN